MSTTALIAGGAAFIGFGLALVLALVLYKQAKVRRTLELDNAELRASALKNQDQVQKLSVGIKTQTDKQQAAEHELRRTAADLGLMKTKAKALSETLGRISPLCPATGLPNRRTFDDHLGAEWRRAMREKKPLTLIMIEPDSYDDYIQTYGSQSGDALLKRIAKLTTNVGHRAGDVAARLEGARFGLVLPGCDTRNATRFAEILRKHVEMQKIPHESSGVNNIVTIHIGVATLIPTSAHSTRELLDRIDNAMYEAKFQGGNRVVTYRALGKLRLERWDSKSDGTLNPTALIHKLEVWGYEGKPTIYPVGAVLPDRSFQTETIFSVLTGELELNIEGQTIVLKFGDCLFIPPGITFNASVAGNQQVMCYEAPKVA